MCMYNYTVYIYIYAYTHATHTYCIYDYVYYYTCGTTHKEHASLLKGSCRSFCPGAAGHAPCRIMPKMQMRFGRDTSGRRGKLCRSHRSKC